MSQDILIKNIPLSYLKTKANGFFDSAEFSNFERLFDKYKTKIDLNPVEVEDYEIFPLTELKNLLVNKYLSLEYLIETEQQKNDLIFIQLSGKKENSLNFEQKKFITSSMADLKNTTPFFISIFLNNIYLNMFTSGLKEAKKTASSSTINTLLSKPKVTVNVSHDIANVSNFFDRIKDPLVYNNIEYDSLLKFNNIKNGIVVNPSSIPNKIIKRKIATLENYNANNLKERSNNLKYKLFMKYYDHRFKFPESSMITIEDDVPALDILTSLLTNNNKLYILSIYREMVLNTNEVIITHGLSHNYFKLLAYDKTTGAELDTTTIIDTIVHDTTNKSTTVRFKTNLNAELLIISDNYEPERILRVSLINYYILSNLHENIEVYSSTITNQKVILDIKNYNQGFGMLEVIETSTKEIILPTSTKFTDSAIELYFENKTGVHNINIYILPTHKVISNISKIKITCNNIFDFLKNQNPFDSSLKAWREFNND